MRGLSDTFMHALTAGFLTGITRRVTRDMDLDLEIRDNYINIYFKGNSLLKLTEKRPEIYQVSIHPKFLQGCTVPDKFTDENSVNAFWAAIPTLKENIIQYGKSSLEIEYEQLIIRANNYELRNNSDYFVVDRQYVAGKSGRYDLAGFYWKRNGRRGGQTVPLCLMEVKFALNADIQDVDQQLARYYQAISQDPAGLAEELEMIFMQKLALGLFDQAANRLDAMKTLTFSRNLDDFQFILLLVDYNPYSSHLNLNNIAALPFASQVHVYYGGFALWHRNLTRFYDKT